MAIETREFVPATYPPFPEGLPTIDLQTLSLVKLESGDVEEQDRLVEVCKTQGFFYLDFTHSTFSTLPSDAERVVEISEDVFKLSAEEKAKCNPDFITNHLFGYKAPGVGVVDRFGTKTTNEFFNLSKTDLFSSTPIFPLPPPIQTKTPFLTTYMSTAHCLGLSLLSILATKLSLPPSTITNLHRFHEPSGDHIRMTRGPPRLTPSNPEIQTAGHTDFGSITILFNWLGGLQIWSDPSHGGAGFTKVVDLDSLTATWLWVRPKPGCAIINLGDAAVKFTNGLFCSGRHRVVPAPGVQGKLPRYSVVYFVRPEDGAVLKTLEAEGIPRPETVEREVTAKQWIAEQIQAMLGTQAGGKV